MARHKFNMAESYSVLDYGWYGSRFIITLEAGKENIYQVTWPRHLAHQVGHEIMEGTNHYVTPQV